MTSPAPSASVDLDSPPPTAAELAGHEIPPRRGAPGSTKGAISCGDKRCVAGKEECRFITEESVWAWTCVPPESDASDPPSTGHYPCDDASDCPSGKTCCLSFASAEESYLCAARTDGACREEVCAAGEEGASDCPSGRVCSGGLCLVKTPPGPTCQGKRRCPAEKPVCMWRGGAGECISEEKLGEVWPLRLESADDGGVALLACTRNEDCGPGNHCCTGFMAGPREGRCALHCDMLNTMQYCDSDADCPKGAGMAWKCKALGELDVELPKWSKTCQVVTP